MALSTDDLRAFLLVTQERSVTRAAALLGVTQQSVSERTRRLERRLGVQLFSRKPHGMQPTSAGYRFLPYAAQCVALLEQAVAVINDDELMRVRVQRSASEAVMPLLEGLTESFRIEISLGDEAADLLAQVGDGKIDVALGVFDASSLPGRAEASLGHGSNGHASADDGDPAESEPPTRTADVQVEALFTDPIVWVVPPEHPLAASRTPRSLLELSSMPVSSPEGSGDGESAGLRVIARSIVADELADGRLVEVPVDQPGWVVPISIAYRSSDHDRPALAALRRAVVERHGASSSSSSQLSASGGGPRS